MRSSRGPTLTAPKLTVPLFRPSIGQDEIDEVVDTLRSGHLTTGLRVQRFERDFAAFLGVPHAVAVSSATGALHLALEAVGVGPGDTVIVPTMTFTATAEVVHRLGARPVFVDCDPTNLSMDLAALEQTIQAVKAQVACAGGRPPFGTLKAIIPMHYGGQMMDPDAVRDLAAAAGAFVIEDAAHALPAYYRKGRASQWRSVGTASDICCFSFYANKPVTTGEGGMAVTANPVWAARMRMMSLHGMSRGISRFGNRPGWFYHIEDAGFKYNLPDLAAALGIHQLKRARKLWERRQEIAARYSAELQPLGLFDLPVEEPDRRHSWHLYSMRLIPSQWSIGRDEFTVRMAERGVGTSVHWLPLHLHPFYARTFRLGSDDLPVATREWERLVSLPIFPDMTATEQGHVIASIVGIAEETRALRQVVKRKRTSAG